jgi:hypothetical protein
VQRTEFSAVCVRLSMRRRTTEILPENELKYAPGAGPQIPASARPLGVLEIIVLVHTGTFLIVATWGYGGDGGWARTALAWWGSLGVLITLTAVQDKQAWADGWMRPLTWAWPVVLLNLLVLAGTLNPGYREIQEGTETLLVTADPHPAFPASALPALSLRALWTFDAAWITAFNVALVLRQRRALRALLLLLVGNALVLALFGIVQKLAGATGIYFRELEPPGGTFFSTFHDHEAWGGFVVLMLALCLALTWHYSRRMAARSLFHSPAFGGAGIVVVLLVTLWLSFAHTAAVLAAVLLCGGILHGTVATVRRRRRFRESIVLPVAGAVAAVMVVGAGTGTFVYYHAAERAGASGDTPRLLQASDPVPGAVIPAGAPVGWRLAADRPWFGGGPGAHRLASTSRSPRDGGQDAAVSDPHGASDRLRVLVDYGGVGAALLLACVFVPVLRLRVRHFSSAIPRYLVVACLGVGGYGWIAAPFGHVAVVIVWWLCFFTAIHYARLEDRDDFGPRKSAR